MQVVGHPAADWLRWFAPAEWLGRPPRDQGDVLDAARRYAAATCEQVGDRSIGALVWAAYWTVFDAERLRSIETRLAERNNV